jgi:hypothetical protein
MSINISPDTSNVVIQGTTNTVTVVDATNSVNVSTSQPITNVITVAIPGPQGAPGEIPSTGSFATTASLNSFTLSYSTGSFTGSFIGILVGTASLATSASHVQGYVLNLSTSSFVTNSQTSSFVLNSSTSSFVTNSQTSSFVLNSSTSSFVTNSQTGSYATTGSVTFIGNQIVTGSTRGNVTALSITSNTASIDLSTGNFFTLQLVSGSNTYINPSNILPGQTSLLTLSTTGSATVSFPSFVKQPSGSAYIPTTSTGVDILTFVSVDSSTLYVANIKNMI